MSQIFTLRGRGATLSVNFENPIELDPQYDYALALIGFHTYNTIPNIEEDINNKLYYWDLGNGSKEKVVSIPTGSYEINDIESYLRKQVIPKSAKEAEYNDYFSLKPNNNTLKCEINSKHKINFTPTDSLGSLLGYSNRTLAPNTLHQSDLPVQIVKVITIHIDCNITSGAFYNNKPSHTIFEFAPSVNPGYAIDIEPRNLLFLPIINKREIHNITLTILDQNSEFVNFRGEEIIIRLELKKLWA